MMVIASWCGRWIVSVPLVIAELHRVPLLGNLFRGHEVSPVIAELASQRFAVESMTGCTSLHLPHAAARCR
jgi:hypothetical protein